MATKKTKVTNEQLCAALMAHGSIREAAAVLGITEKTIYNRMNDDEFRDLFAGTQRKILSSSIIACQNKMTDAINCIADIMNDKKINPQTRLLAAQTILKNGLSMCELAGILTEQEKTANSPFEQMLADLGI